MVSIFVIWYIGAVLGIGIPMIRLESTNPSLKVRADASKKIFLHGLFWPIYLSYLFKIHVINKVFK